MYSYTAKPTQTKLGLMEVEYVGHLVSATGTSFTPEKRLKVLNFPKPSTQKEMLQLLGLVKSVRLEGASVTFAPACTMHRSSRY